MLSKSTSFVPAFGYTLPDAELTSMVLSSVEDASFAVLCRLRGSSLLSDLYPNEYHLLQLYLLWTSYPYTYNNIEVPIVSYLTD